MIRFAACILILWSTSAFAGILPITGQYCNDGHNGSMLNADGIWSEEDAPFDGVVQSGPNWWVVTFKDDPSSVTMRIVLDHDKQTIMVIDSDKTDETDIAVFHRCP